uniref:Reduced folate carrier n=1 Tax=Anopheles culicifacies TaxID=139723 RepID=A0A182MKJ0_9DIPT
MQKLSSSRMQQWLKISLLVCTFGFLKEIRPSEPFIVDYLAGPWRNLTMDQIVQEAFPIGTYSYLAQLAIIFLVTDFLRYKPIIIVNGAAGIIVWSMLTWTTSLNALKVLEIFYGTYCAAEVAYFSYIYAKVDREHYQKVTSHTRAAIYSGRFFAASLAQLLVYFEAMDYRQLNYLSLAAQISATLWALFLPSVPTSMYFHRKTLSEEQQPDSITVQCTIADKQGKTMDGIEDDRSDDSKPPAAPTDRPLQPSLRSRLKGAFVLLWTHFRISFTNRNVLQWSIWYALAMAGYIQILAYVQALWSSIDETQPALWNGAVEAALTLLGAIVSLLAGYLHSGFLKPRTSLLSLALLSFAAGGAMLLATKTGDLIVSYVGYMIFCVLYAFAITVVSAEIAKNISDDCFGLVFGFNTLVALSLQTLLTFSVTDSDAPSSPPAAASSALPLLGSVLFAPPSVLLFSLAEAEREKKSSFTVSPTKPPAAFAPPSVCFVTLLKAGLLLLASVAKLTLSSILKIDGASLLLLVVLLPPPVAADCLAKLPKVKPLPPPKTGVVVLASPKAVLPKVAVAFTGVLLLVVVVVMGFGLEPKMLPPVKIFVLPVVPKPPLEPKPLIDDPKNVPVPSTDLDDGCVVRDAGCNNGLLLLVASFAAATPFLDSFLSSSTVVDVTCAPAPSVPVGGETNDDFGVVLRDAEKIDPPEEADPIAVEPLKNASL